MEKNRADQTETFQESELWRNPKVNQGIEAGNNTAEFCLHLFGHRLQFGILYGLHGCHRVYGRHFDFTLFSFVHNHFAGKHGSNCMRLYAVPFDSDDLQENADNYFMV